MLFQTSLLRLGAVSFILLAGPGARDILNPGHNYRVSDSGVDIAQPSQQRNGSAAQVRSLVTLPDGVYQVCSQPEPTDWHGGAGVCFNFNKLGHHVEGYYGYPHSDRFICIRGEVSENVVTGEALATSWAGARWDSIPASAFEWDDEKHLSLDQGEMIQTSDDAANPVEWILFRRAILNLDGFYQYSHLRMNSPSELCHFL